MCSGFERHSKSNKIAVIWDWWKGLKNGRTMLNVLCQCTDWPTLWNPNHSKSQCQNAGIQMLGILAPTVFISYCTTQVTRGRFRFSLRCSIHLRSMPTPNFYTTKSLSNPWIFYSDLCIGLFQFSIVGRLRKCCWSQGDGRINLRRKFRSRIRSSTSWSGCQ